MMNRAIALVLVGLLVTVADSCSGNADPSDSVVGSYIASTFTFGGVTEGDVLTAGGKLDITLTVDGTTEGSLFVPASLADGEDFRADMTGTYQRTGDIVRFSQNADTFVRDMAWQVQAGELNGSATFQGVTITVVLTRQ